MDWETRIGAYAWVERADGAVLVTHWTGQRTHDGRSLRGGWGLPGGGVGLHEGPEQAAVREVAEETGYEVELAALLGTTAVVVPPHDRARPSPLPLKLLQLYYRAQVAGGQPRSEEGGTTDEVRWTTLEELAGLPRSPMIDICLELMGRPPLPGVPVLPLPVNEGNVAKVVEAARAAPVRGPVKVIAIDGPSGSGKTVLASAVALDLGCPVVQTDDLVPGWDGLDQVVDLLTDQVLKPLARGERAAYRRWDWLAGQWAEMTEVPATDTLVVEGCCSSVGRAGEHAAVRVWVEASPQLRMRRGMARDGAALRDQWESWAAQERAVFAADGTRDRADVVVDTDPEGSS